MRRLKARATRRSRSQQTTQLTANPRARSLPLHRFLIYPTHYIRSFLHPPERQTDSSSSSSPTAARFRVGVFNVVSFAGLPREVVEEERRETSERSIYWYRKISFCKKERENARKQPSNSPQSRAPIPTSPPHRESPRCPLEARTDAPPIHNLPQRLNGAVGGGRKFPRGGRGRGWVCRSGEEDRREGRCLAVLIRSAATREHEGQKIKGGGREVKLTPGL